MKAPAVSEPFCCSVLTRSRNDCHCQDNGNANEESPHREGQESACPMRTRSLLLPQRPGERPNPSDQPQQEEENRGQERPIQLNPESRWREVEVKEATHGIS